MSIERIPGFVTLEEAYNEAIKLVEQRANGEIRPIKTMWPLLNKNLGGGLVPNTTMVIGGRPGVGKSAFSNRMIFSAYNYAEQAQIDIVVVYWNLEMPNWNQILRELSHKTKKSIRDLMSVEAVLAKEEIEKLKELKTFFVGKQFYMTTESTTAESFRKRMKAVRDRFKTSFIINLIDHTRLIRNSKDETKEEEKIYNLLFHSTRLAVEDGMCNIVLSQLNRNIESEARVVNPVPMLSDFFGADAVGQFGNICMILVRPEMYNIKTFHEFPSKGLLVNHILKNRDGDVCYIPFSHNLATNTILSHPMTK